MSVEQLTTTAPSCGGSYQKHHPDEHYIRIRGANANNIVAHIVVGERTVLSDLGKLLRQAMRQLRTSRECCVG